MGVEDNGGTGTRTETTDRPTSEDRPYTPPPDNPGSPGQPSRLESRARTRQDQEQSKGQDTGGAQSTAGPRDAKPGSSQAGGATESAGTQSRSETGQGSPRNEEPRSRDAGAQAGGSSPGSRDRSQAAQVTERETDTRTEPADKPTPPAQQYALPADNPGSPGQPSRLESRARTRQDQEQNKTQDASSSSAAGLEGGDRNDRANPQQMETGGQKADDTDAGRDVRETGKSGHAPANGEGTRDDEREPEARPRDTGTPTNEVLGRDEPGDRDRPAPQLSGEQAGNRVPEAPRPQDQEHEPLPRQEAAPPPDSRTAPDTEQPSQDTDKPSDGSGAQGSAPQEAGTDSAPGAPESRGRDANPVGDSEPKAPTVDGPTDNGPASPSEAAEAGDEQPLSQQQDRPAAEQPTGQSQDSQRPLPAEEQAEAGRRQDGAVEQGAEIQEPLGVPEDPNSETGDRQTTDNTPSSSGETADNHGTQEPHAEDDGDRGKKAEDDGTEQDPNETNETNPEAHPNPILSDVYTDSSGQVHIEPRYGREQTGQPGTELAQNEPETTEPAELPTREDLDPVGAQGGDAGRGELRNPDDDPASRDLLDEDAEGIAQWKRTGRDFIRRPDDVAKSTEGLAKDLGNIIKWDRPTGTAESKPAIEIKPHHESIQGATAAIGFVGAGIIVYELGRRTHAGIKTLLGKVTGAENADN
ncbi:hypothetical protein [Actinomadura geliboluensis]|uniref:hypothetical protein n=1 Tax=Actinomadura geliboluensis TaxID=882440 RepID=UPI0036A541CE